MGGDRRDDEGDGGVTSQSGPEYRRNDDSTCGGRRLGSPPVADDMEAARSWTLKEYINRQQATIAAQVAFWKIY